MCLHQIQRAKKPDWSSYYSGSKEIHEYFDEVATKYNLKRYVRFEHRVVRAEWLDSRGQWEVTVSRNGNSDDTIVDYADFFLHGGGVLK
jgi:cation diffusion facilitator CzcD-associated flavoprotein CzcO